VEKPILAQFSPCVWPNRCAKASSDSVEKPILAQFRPCVWPNRCRSADPKTWLG